MADRRPPSSFDADDRSPRHLRVDDRPIVRDLDDRQLAAEAVAALRAEHGGATTDDLIPFDPPPAASEEVLEDPACGRHRRDVRIPPSPDDRHAGKTRPVNRSGAAAAPVAAGHRPPRVAFSLSSPTSPPVPRPHRRPDQPLGVTESPAGSTGGADAHPGDGPARRSLSGRGLLLVAGLGLVVLAAILIARVLVDNDDVPSTVTVGTPPEASATTSTGPASTTPGTAGVGALGSSAAGTAVGNTAPSGAGRPDPTATSADTTPDSGPAGVIADPATGPVPRTPPPAVVSTLSPGDSGFGWPSTAFGRPGD